MANETTISGLGKASGVSESDIIPIVSVSDSTTEKVTLGTLRNSIYFQNAFSDHTTALAATSKGDSYFVYTDTTETYVKGWVNQGGSNYSAMIGLNGDVIFPAGSFFSVLKSYVMGVDSFADLRSLEPLYEGQRVKLKGWNSGSYYGGGEFVAISGSATDDGGLTAVVSSTSYWIRTLSLEKLDVTHFGAIPDGTTDCVDAAIAMYNWSQNAGNKVGIQFPAGEFNWGTNWDISASQIQFFRMTGPSVDYGYFPQTTINLSGVSDGTAITVQSRFTDISGFYLNGDVVNTPNTRHFFQNTVTRGQYFRGSNLFPKLMGGRTLQLKDTLDTKISQFYPTGCTASFLYVTYSNEASWTHSTAIELSNFNIGGQTGEPAIYAPLCAQSIMRNGWFDHCEDSFNIIGGAWTLDNVTVEAGTGAVNPKVYGCNFVQLSGNFRGVDLDFDTTNGITPLLNGYDQGHVIIKDNGARFDYGLSSRYSYSPFRAYNYTSSPAWVHVGSLAVAGVGDSVKVRVLGGGGFAHSTTTMSSNNQNYGGGEATILFQDKSTQTSGVVVSWYGAGSSPVLDVKYTQSYNNIIDLYIKVQGYTMPLSVFIESTDVSRLESGGHFVFTSSMATVADISDISDTLDAPSRVNFTNGTYGFGMDFDNGVMAIDADFAGSGGLRYVPVISSGTTRYIKLEGNTNAVTLPAYTFGYLPDASTYTNGLIIVRKTSKGTVTAISDGTNWLFSGTGETLS